MRQGIYRVPKTDSIRLPNSKQRIAILGRTGSGKTIAALWHLSNTNFAVRPWIIIDFKTDQNINAIPRAQYIGVDEIPKHPGIYIMQPVMEEMDTLADTMEKIRVRENIGLYIDEGYMMNESNRVDNKFRTLLTQGRSKHIPMIVLSQRPVWINRFVFSESEFFQIFHLQDKRDVQTIASFLPSNSIIRLPDFHSVYYDVGRNHVSYLSPVPNENEILEKIDNKLKPIRKFL